MNDLCVAFCLFWLPAHEFSGEKKIRFLIPIPYLNGTYWTDRMLEWWLGSDIGDMSDSFVMSQWGNFLNSLYFSTLFLLSLLSSQGWTFPGLRERQALLLENNEINEWLMNSHASCLLSRNAFWFPASARRLPFPCALPLCRTFEKLFFSPSLSTSPSIESASPPSS